MEIESEAYRVEVYYKELKDQIDYRFESIYELAKKNGSRSYGGLIGIVGRGGTFYFNEEEQARNFCLEANALLFVTKIDLHRELTEKLVLGLPKKQKKVVKPQSP